MLDAQSILNVAGVSLLTATDEQLFRAAFSHQPLQYAHSWLYMLRAAHVNEGEMGFKYVSAELLAVIGFRHDYVYVTPLFDTSNGVQLEQLCRQLSKVTRHRILLRKLPQPAAKQLPFAEASTNIELPLEDDTCPETVLQLHKLFMTPDASKLNPMAQKLTRRAAAFEHLGVELHIVEDLSKVPFEKLQRFLAQDTEKHASYLPIVTYLHQQKPDKYKYRVMVFLDKDRVRGLYMTEVLSLTEVGMYGGITSKDVGGITEWMDVYFFKQLFLDGVRKVHLGGAENEGIAEYVSKLFPYKPAYFARTLLYDPSKKAEDVKVSIRLVEPTDFNDLAQLYRSLYNSLSDLGEVWTKEAAHRFISHFHQRQPDLFFLAEFNGEPVGTIVAAVQPWWDGNHLVEGEVVTDPIYQNSTLTKQLMKALLTKARRKYHVVSWDTFTPVTHEHPLGAYKEIGFTDVPEWAAISGDVHVVLERLGV